MRATRSQQRPSPAPPRALDRTSSPHRPASSTLRLTTTLLPSSLATARRACCWPATPRLGRRSTWRTALNGVRVGAPSLAALQVTDALGAQAGHLGQFLLRQSGGFPQMPQPLAERGI